jgi:hypothetical protein
LECLKAGGDAWSGIIPMICDELKPSQRSRELAQPTSFQRIFQALPSKFFSYPSGITCILDKKVWMAIEVCTLFYLQLPGLELGLDAETIRGF